MSYKLKKELELLELFCISSGAMISSGLFILPGLAFAKTGPSLIFSYLLASILMIPTVLSKAELATAMPKAGGNYFFIDRSMGPWMGTLGGLADWFSVSLKGVFALLGMGIFLLLLNPGITEFQIKLIALACCLIFSLINIIGVKLTGRFQMAMVITLLGLLILYIIAGLPSIQFHRYIPFMPYGLGSVLSTAGFVFISYAGLTKIAEIAEEVKDPGRDIPRALILSWLAMSLLYLLVLFMTIGLVEPAQLADSLTPISLGAGTVMGWGGSILMGVAALLAFATTANAGLLAASRTPMAMSKDELLPPVLRRLSRHGTPVSSIIFTASFMIVAILLLNLEDLVKAASTLVLLLFIFVNISVIIMREGKITHYRPKFRAPLYPWAQIFGIVAYGTLIFEMGLVPLLMVAVFVVLGSGWYWIYASGKIRKEYALLHVIERILGIKSTGYLLEEELREILIDRDNITGERFEHLMERCPVIELKASLTAEEFAKIVANSLAKRAKLKPEKLFKLLIEREKEREIIIHSGVACLSISIPGSNIFEIMLIRDKEGVTFSQESSSIYAAFVIVYTPDQRIFFLHALMWIVGIAEATDFDRRWLDAQDEEELRDIILASWREGSATSARRGKGREREEGRPEPGSASG